MTDELAEIFGDFGDLLSGLVFEADADLSFTRVGGRVPHIARDPAADLIGRSLLEIGEFMTDLQARHVFVRAVRRREKVTGLRYHVADGDGRPGTYEFSARPLFRDGGFAGYRGLIRDVTASTADEADLIAACEDAEVANRAKSEFLTGISHELRTPLNAIIGFSEIIRQETFGPLGDARYREYIGDILASGRSLLSLINEMLDISRLETQSVTLQEDEVNIAATVGTCLKEFEPRFKERGITLHISVNPHLPRIWADGQAVRQMVSHLLSNAQKFADPGGRVAVSAGCEETGDLILSVADTGIGIPKDRLDKVLIPFVQNDEGFVRGHGGMGLGLAITKALMDLHGGQIDIDSTAGVGTRVDLVFPGERLIEFPDQDVG